MKAFITGSHAYGTPHEESDIDLVVLADGPTIEKLAEVLAFEMGSAVDDVDASIKLGKLNLIVCSTEEQWQAWHTGTEQLKARAPVTRDEAKALFEQLLGKTSATATGLPAGVPEQEF